MGREQHGPRRFQYRVRRALAHLKPAASKAAMSRSAKVTLVTHWCELAWESELACEGAAVGGGGEAAGVAEGAGEG
eukprot:1192070-Prorocentrum_minimum.AAC.2